MTAIVGIADGQQVWLGGDSAGVSGFNRTIRADSKVFVSGAMVFGFTSSFRMGQLLRYKLEAPRYHPDDDAMTYLCGDWIDAVRATLKGGGFASVTAGVEQGGKFLIGFKGKLYCVESDFQIGESVDQFHAVGCGDSYALGSLHATKTTKASPVDRIERALEAAAYFSAGVAPPFVTVVGANK